MENFQNLINQGLGPQNISNIPLGETNVVDSDKAQKIFQKSTVYLEAGDVKTMLNAPVSLKEEYKLAPYVTKVDKYESPVTFFFQKVFRKICLFLHISHSKEKVDFAKKVLNDIVGGIEVLDESKIDQISVRELVRTLKRQKRQLEKFDNTDNEQRILELGRLVDTCEFFYEVQKGLDKVDSEKSLLEQFTNIQQSLSERLENLNESEKLLLPGNYFSPDRAYSEGMIEIIKGEDQFIYRFVSTDESKSTERVGNLEKTSILPFLEWRGSKESVLAASLDVMSQQFKPLIKNFNSLKKIIKFFDTGEQLGQALSLLEGNIQPEKLITTAFNGQKPLSDVDDTNQNDIYSQYTTASRNANIRKRLFYRARGSSIEQFNQIGLITQYQAFMSLVKAHPNIYKNKHISADVYESARHLVHKVQAHAPVESKSALLEPLQDLIDKIDSLPSKREKKLQSMKVAKFKTHFAIIDNEFSTKGMHKVKAKGILVKSLIDPQFKVLLDRVSKGTPLTDSLKEEFVEGFKNELAVCRQLYNKGKFSKLESTLIELIQSMPNVNADPHSEDNFWPQIREELIIEGSQPPTTILSDLSRYFFEIIRTQHSLVPTEEIIFSTSKLFVINDSLQDDDFKEYVFRVPHCKFLNAVGSLHYPDNSILNQAQEILNYTQRRQAQVFENFNDTDKNKFSIHNINWDMKFGDAFKTDHMKLEGKDLDAYQKFNKGETENPFANSLHTSTLMAGLCFFPFAFFEKDHTKYQKTEFRMRDMQVGMGAPVGGFFTLQPGGVRDFNLSVMQRAKLNSLRNREKKGKDGIRPFMAIPSDLRGKTGDGSLFKWRKPKIRYANKNRHKLWKSKREGYSKKYLKVMKKRVLKDKEADLEGLFFSYGTTPKDLEIYISKNEPDEFTRDMLVARNLVDEQWSGADPVSNIEYMLDYMLGSKNYLLNDDFYQVVVDSFYTPVAVSNFLGLDLKARQSYINRILTSIETYSSLGDIKSLNKYYEVLFLLVERDTQLDLTLDDISAHIQKMVFAHGLPEKTESVLNYLHLAYNKGRLNLDQLDDASVLTIYKGLFAAQAEIKDIKLNIGLEKRIESLLTNCTEFLNQKENESLAKQIALEVSLEPKSTSVQGDFPFYEIGPVTVNLQEVLLLRGKKQVMKLSSHQVELLKNSGLPREIIERIVKDRRCYLTTYKEEKGHKQTILTPVDYPSIRFIPTNDNLVIQKKFNEHNSWMSMIDQEGIDKLYEEGNFSRSLHTLQEGLTLWFDNKSMSSLYLEDPQTGSLVYELDCKRKKGKAESGEDKKSKSKKSIVGSLTAGAESIASSIQGKGEDQAIESTFKINGVKRLSDGAILNNVNVDKIDPDNVFTMLDSPENVQIWSKEGKVKEVIYTRLRTNSGAQLRYKVKTSITGKLILKGLDDFEGYTVCIDKEKFLNEHQMGSILPAGVDQYHILYKNPEGPVKVFMPLVERGRSEKLTNVQNREKTQAEQSKLSFKDMKEEAKSLMAQEQRSESNLDNLSKWSTKSYANFNSAAPKLECMTSDLDVIKGFKTSNRAHDAYLAYICMTSKNYEEAADYLWKSQELGLMSDSKLSIYDKIDAWDDNTIDGLTLKLKAKLACLHTLQYKEPPVSMDDIDEEVGRMVELKALIEMKAGINYLSEKLLPEESNQLTLFQESSIKWKYGVNLDATYRKASSSAMNTIAGYGKGAILEAARELAAKSFWIGTRSTKSKLANKISYLQDNQVLTRRAQAYFKNIERIYEEKDQVINTELINYQVSKEQLDILGGRIPDALKEKIMKNNSVNLNEIRVALSELALDLGYEKYEKVAKLIEDFERYVVISKAKKSSMNALDEQALYNEFTNTYLNNPKLIQDTKLGSMSLENILLRVSTDENLINDLTEQKLVCQEAKDFCHGLHPDELTAESIHFYMKGYIELLDKNPLLKYHPKAKFPKDWNKKRSVLQRFRIFRLVTFISAAIKFSVFQKLFPYSPLKQLEGFFHVLEPYGEEANLDVKLMDTMVGTVLPDQPRVRPAGDSTDFGLDDMLNPKGKKVEQYQQALLVLEKKVNAIQLLDIEPEVDVDIAESKTKTEPTRLFDNTLSLKKKDVDQGESADELSAPVKSISSVTDELKGINEADLDLKDSHMSLTSVIKVSEYYQDIEYFQENLSVQAKPEALNKKEYKELKKKFSDLSAEYEQNNQLDNYNSKIAVEARILEAITSVNEKAENILKTQRKMIPMRLIGLYSEGKLDHQSLEIALGVKINPEAISSLEDDVESYMRSIIFEKHMNRVKDFIDSHDYKDFSDENLLQEFSDLLDLSRYFNKQQDPEHYKELLSIEFINGFILRKSQVDTIRAMLEKPNSIRQLGMGEGKSSVILPFLLHEATDGKQLAVGIVPESLFPIVKDELKVSCKGIFGQDLCTFEFDRNCPVDIKSLYQQYYNLKSAIAQKNPVLTTRTSLLSFRDKYLEIIYEKSQTIARLKSGELEPKTAASFLDSFESQLKVISEMLDLLKSRGRVYADEADSILDLKQEYNYAIDSLAEVDEPVRKDVLDIFKTLAKWKDSDDEDRKILFTEVHDNRQQMLSDSNQNRICEYLACDMIENLKEKLPESQNLNNPEFMKELTKYMLEPSYMSEEVESWIAKISDQTIRETLGTTMNILSKVMPSILKKTNLEHFGRDGQYQMFTVPYKSCRTPSTSEYGEMLQRVGYACLDYFQKGINKEQYDEAIAVYLVEYQLIIDGGQSEEGVTEEALEEALGLLEEFKKNYGVSLFEANRDPSVVDEILNKKNSDPLQKLDFLEKRVLDHVRIANKQVSSNVFDLVSMFPRGFAGFTGTTWNTSSYHRSIDTSTAKTAGTDGKSGEYLLREFKSGKVRIIEIDDGVEGANILDQIIQSAGGDEFFENYDAIIDSGAYFKDENLDQVARHCLNKMDPKGSKSAVVYVDSENRKLIHEKGAYLPEDLKLRTDISLSQQFKIYDQWHTIGTDLKHKKNARALVTLATTKVKDLQQAIWRMRGLRKGEHIDLIVTKEVKQELIQSRQKYLATLDLLIESGQVDNIQQLQEVYNYFSSLSSNEVVMDDVLIYVNMVQDREVKPLNLQRHIMEMKEIVNSLKIDAFQEIHKSLKSVQERLRDAVDEEAYNEILLARSQAESIFVHWAESSIIKEIKYRADEIFERVTKGKTDEVLADSLNAYIEEVKQIANPETLMDMFIDTYPDSNSENLKPHVENFAKIFALHAQICLEQTLEQYQFLEAYQLPSEMPKIVQDNLDREVAQETNLRVETAAQVVQELAVEVEQQNETVLRVISEQEIDTMNEQGKEMYTRKKCFYRTIDSIICSHMATYSRNLNQMDSFPNTITIKDVFMNSCSDIKFSNNLTQVFVREKKGSKKMKEILDSSLFSKNRVIPKYAVAISYFDETWNQVRHCQILLDTYDAHEVRCAVKNFKESDIAFSLRLYNLSQDEKPALISVERACNIDEKLPQDGHLRDSFEESLKKDQYGIVMARLYRGASQICKHEFDLFEEWFDQLEHEEQQDIVKKYFGIFWDGKSIRGNLYQKLAQFSENAQEQVV